MFHLQGENLEDARRTIENERQEKAMLMGIITTLANTQGPRNDFRGARFGGGVAIDSGTQTGGTLNDFSDEQGAQGSG